MSEKVRPEIIASAKAESNIPAMKAGNYAGVCYGMALIGTIKDTYEGKPIESKKVRLFFEFPDELIEIDGETLPRRLSKEYTLSLGKNANLRKDLESWRGVAFTDEQAKGFNIVNVVGHPCIINVLNTLSKDKTKTYADIKTITPLVTGMKKPERAKDAEEIIFAYSLPLEDLKAEFLKLPKFVQDKIVTSDEWVALKIERPVSVTEPGATEGPNDEVSQAANATPAAKDGPPF